MVFLILLCPTLNNGSTEDLSDNSHGFILDTINIQIDIQKSMGLPSNPILGSIVEQKIPESYIGNGECTTLIRHYRKIPWSGNANTWWQKALDADFSTGNIQKLNAIMVENSKSPYGHVALVTHVNENSFTIVEQNVLGKGIVSQRILPLDYSTIGFIY